VADVGLLVDALDDRALVDLLGDALLDDRRLDDDASTRGTVAGNRSTAGFNAAGTLAPAGSEIAVTGTAGAITVHSRK
jgi:hypothetical protein